MKMQEVVIKTRFGTGLLNKNEYCRISNKIFLVFVNEICISNTPLLKLLHRSLMKYTFSTIFGSEEWRVCVCVLEQPYQIYTFSKEILNKSQVFTH